MATNLSNKLAMVKTDETNIATQTKHPTAFTTDNSS